MESDERMRVVRSVRLRPDQYRKHWERHGISTRSGHIRTRLDHADNFDFLRESVQWFATIMEVRLRENDHKGGWENEPLPYFVERMKDELKEIEVAMAGSYRFDLMVLVDECGDLANVAMMLAETAHRNAMEWDEEETEHGRE